MSPEVDQEDDDGYGVKADIWSLGVMFNELVFGRCCKPARPSWSVTTLSLSLTHPNPPLHASLNHFFFSLKKKKQSRTLTGCSVYSLEVALY